MAIEENPYAYVPEWLDAAAGHTPELTIDGERWSITYALLPSEFAAGSIRTILHFPRMRSALIGGWLVVGGLVLSEWIRRPSPFYPLLGLTLLAAGFPLFCWFVAQVVFRVIMGVHDKSELAAYRRVTIWPEGFSEATSDAARQVRWKSVERLVATRHELFISQGLTAAALIIPARSFASAPEFRRFCDAAMAFRAQAKDAIQES
jgi:hypothetical protein